MGKAIINGIVSITKTIIIVVAVLYAFDSGIVDNVVNYFK